jgi:uroporphyrinogen III methyltransferase/synthase
LRGLRIIVTRAREQAGELSHRLAELGAEPIEVPAIRIAPVEDAHSLDRAIERLSSYDWVIFTSRNGATAFWQRLEALGLDGRALEGARVAAIGPATAAALRAQGIEPDYVPEEYVAEAILAGIGDVAGRRILLPRADIARRALAEGLRARGAHVDEIVAYRTLPADAPLPDLSQADAITFTSSSTVRHFVRAVGGPDALQGPVIACIGPITAATCRELGITPDVVAGEYTVDGLVRALVEHFAGAKESERYDFIGSSQ